MKILTEKHKEMLSLMVNEWSFKAFVLEYDYDADKTVRKLFHESLGKDDYEYTDEEGVIMNRAREMWIEYLNGKHDYKMAKKWADFKPALAHYKK